MSEAKKTFIQLCIDGEVLPQEVDDFVDRWHEGTSELELHEFLGMTWDEYSAWVQRSDVLPRIIKAHAEHRSFKTNLEPHIPARPQT